MPTVFSITTRGYGGEAITPGAGIITRECTFIFETEQQATAWRDRNADVYHSVTDVRSVYVGIADYLSLLNTTKPSIRRRLTGANT